MPTISAVQIVLSAGAGESCGWRLGLLLSAVLLVAGCTSAPAPLPAGAQTRPTGPYDAFYGVYRVGADHTIGFTRFVTDDRQDAVLMSDYQSGVVRRVFPVSVGVFAMGPGFSVQEPVELTVRFVEDGGAITGVSLRSNGGKETFAERLPLAVEDVVINADEATLSGTLMIPPGKGPHPAIVLLHGSGPLTRWSVGPYPHFFASLGFAVVIYDKRGTGSSTGARLDASSGALATMPDAYYPNGLANDALAVFEFLQQRSDINPKAIGFWGSSEGGMLATQAAAREPDVAFAINSSGFMGPLWETLAYQVEPILRRDGHPEDIAEARELTDLWMRVARTGKDYELFVKKREQARRRGKPWMLTYVSDEFTSLEQMRWAWDHILAFSPLPALPKVNAAVLGLFGAADPLTDAHAAASAMKTALSGRDITTRIVPNAGHSLSEPNGARMAPGVFDTLRNWLRQRVPLPRLGQPS